ncbi:MAG: hypothetical protein KC897_06075 [Candidatus Omnitrophica bacterium]|nr:hypothetical protein [Candidatus Omnitrophota bacterium]MCB9719756.1 hypothetical protein [Candidatus Omnitrophota bacterium]
MNKLTTELLTRFPELRSRVVDGDEGLPYQMMNHLFDWVLEEMRAQRLVDVSPRVVDFTEWCEDQPPGKDAGDDIATVYTVGFYEKLFEHPETRPLVTRLTTRENLQQPQTRDYLIGAVGQEAYDATLLEFDKLPPSVRALWTRNKARVYSRSRFLRYLGFAGLVLVVLWVVFMVPEIRGVHAFVALLDGEPVPIRRLIVNRPEHWVLNDDDSLKYIAAQLKRKRRQEPLEKDFRTTGTLVFGPWKRVSYTDYILSPDYEYMLIMHDDFGNESYYRIPVNEQTPPELRSMVYAMAEAGRIARIDEERREELQQQQEKQEEKSTEPRIKLPGGGS